MDIFDLSVDLSEFAELENAKQTIQFYSPPSARVMAAWVDRCLIAAFRRESELVAVLESLGLHDGERIYTGNLREWCTLAADRDAGSCFWARIHPAKPTYHFGTQEQKFQVSDSRDWCGWIRVYWYCLDSMKSDTLVSAIKRLGDSQRPIR